MKNDEIKAGWAYHNGTKHSYQSVRMNPHYMDWENQPLPFKLYYTLEPAPLPQHLEPSGIPALTAISAIETASDGEVIPTRQTLAEILYLSAGITRRKKYARGEIMFRAAACTGALYHIDLYIICGDLPDLEAGVYHFGPHDFALRQIRKGDYRAAVAYASGQEPAITNAPAIIAYASTYWRNAWKYQARAYRHCYWDNGTILANTLAAAVPRGLPARVVAGFVDSDVSSLLALDTEREGALSLVALGSQPAIEPAPSPTVEPLVLETAPLSKKEVDYPAIRAMHLSSSLESEAEVAAWRSGSRAMTDQRVGLTTDDQVQPGFFALQPLSDQEMPQDSIEEVIQRRGSTRQFARESITFRQLSTMLDRSTRGISADFLENKDESLNDLYLLVHAVEGLPSGAYRYHREGQVLELLKEGDFRREGGYLGLGQDIPADCSVGIFFLSDLNRVFDRFGNRGYRVAELEASIMAGKLYLAAYALRLGASGLTFFDDDVIEFFSPVAAGKSVMFFIAVGRSAKAPKQLDIIQISS